jgi:hypothetical protein
MDVSRDPYRPRRPRLPVAKPDDVPDKAALTAGVQTCAGGRPCRACLDAVAGTTHSLHRCAEPDCLCHESWRAVAVDWDALVRCGRRHVPPNLAR